MPQSYLPTVLIPFSSWWALTLGIQVIEASLYFRDKKHPTKSEELLSAYASANPKDSDYVHLCLAQIAFAKEGAQHECHVKPKSHSLQTSRLPQLRSRALRLSSTGQLSLRRS